MTLRRAFTLIELLMVIAVLSLLMAILTPTLGNARDRVRAISCMNNAKAIGGGLGAYQVVNALRLVLIYDATQKHKDAEPNMLWRSNTAQVPNNSMSWCNMLTEGGYSGAAEVFLCPNIGDSLYDPTAQANRRLTLQLNRLCHAGKGVSSLAGTALKVTDIMSPYGKVQAAEMGQWDNSLSHGERAPFPTRIYADRNGSGPRYLVSRYDSPGKAGTADELSDYWCGVRPRHMHNNYCTTLFFDGHANLVPVRIEGQEQPEFDDLTNTTLGPQPYGGGNKPGFFRTSSPLLGY